jgi:hypothetical protein
VVSEGSAVGPLPDASALLLRCAGSAMLSPVHWLIAVCGARGALSMFSTRSLQVRRPVFQRIFWDLWPGNKPQT